MKNILVATDFSNSAYNALYFTTQLFKGQKCNFHVMNSFTEHTQLLSQKVSAVGNFSLIEQLTDESEEGLNQVYHKIHLDNGNPLHHFEIHSINEYLTEAIKKVITTHEIDLVVLGNQGHGKKPKLFWGSNVQKVVKEVTDCPILTVPMETEFEIPKEIAFATDYRRNYNAKMLQPLIQLAQLSDASVCILHINEEERLSRIQKSNLYTLREYLAEIRNSVHWMPDFARKSEVIQTFIKELDIGMLAMIRYDHGFISRLIREPVIDDMCFDVDIPFLVMPDIS